MENFTASSGLSTITIRTGHPLRMLVCLRCPGPQVRNTVLKRERVGHVSPNP